MLIMPQSRIRDEKINQLKSGQTVYAESSELIRLIKRDIAKYHLHVHCDQTNTGCWFMPLQEKISS
ncbi:hypothetical protein F3157_01235 [Virgibacillus dakarensis]|uniref:Uncharacterized protein n=1 Tax=Lentibacillus populi TaxID=1827502 RepID=A0A9W5X3P3_9BACI|nr:MULTISPECIES: hypothetical protein [Bacillaceae]MBT2216572.1 hypothetical protein [Virgibacillus dakarensis]MTW84294.1 hypothetical protein [Virgibacillus dakarensis]GGB27563.1 hypothetical protein GCM10011409_01040 [Lentibacillus populi]